MSDIAFPRRWRLLQSEGFSFVFAHRKAVRGEYFQLSFRPNDLNTARFGVVVAKKIARRAVMRNRIKRQAREVFRQRRSGLPAMDLVLRLIKPLPVSPWDALRLRIRGEMETLLDRLPR